MFFNRAGTVRVPSVSVRQTSLAPNLRSFAPCRAAAAEPVLAEAPLAETEPEFSNDEEAKAILRFHRGSPYKVRRVLDAIRGRTYEEALIILTYLPHRPTEPILKVLLSAAANAKHNLGLRKSKLYVSECYCDEGPTMKRFRPRAQGRAVRIMKRTSHITVKVAERDD